MHHTCSTSNHFEWLYRLYRLTANVENENGASALRVPHVTHISDWIAPVMSAAYGGNSLARCVQQAKHDPEAIFELRWSARIPLARPGGAGHDGKTSCYGSNRNGVAGSLRSQQSTQKPALFATRSLAVYSRPNMILCARRTCLCSCRLCS